jgi:hypothetical protein
MNPDPGLTIPWSGILVLSITGGTFIASLLGNWLGTWLGMRKFTRLLSEAADQRPAPAVPGTPPGFPRKVDQSIFDVGPADGEDEFAGNLAQLRSRVK